MARASDAREDWTRIHGVDQRAAFVTFRHDALRRARARREDGPSAGDDAVVAAQRGSACADFVGDTSSVVWPIALRAVRGVLRRDGARARRGRGRGRGRGRDARAGRARGRARW